MTDNKNYNFTIYMSWDIDKKPGNLSVESKK